MLFTEHRWEDHGANYTIEYGKSGTLSKLFLLMPENNCFGVMYLLMIFQILTLALNTELCF